MPTKTTTIGDETKTYTSMAAWEADLDNTGIYVSGDDAIGQVYNDKIYDESVSITSGGVVGLLSRTLTVPTGQRHSGVAGSGVRVVRTIAHDSIIAVGISKTTVEWLELDSNALLNSSGAIIRINNGVHTSDKTQTVFRHNLIHCGSTAGRFQRGIFSETRPYTAIRNCVYAIIGSNTTGSTKTIGIGADDIADIINNTVFNISGGSTNATYGIQLVASDSNRCQNNIVVGIANVGVGIAQSFNTITPTGGQTLDHNLSSDTSAIGAGSIINTAASTLFESTATGSEVLRLVNAAAAKDAGLIVGPVPTGSDLSMPNTGFPDGVDLTLNSQGTSWEIGAYEFLSADSGDPGILPMSVLDDMTPINNGDVVTGWQTGNNTSAEAIDPDVKVQGLNSISCRVNDITIISGLMYDMGSLISLAVKHLYAWGFTSQKVDTKALGGWRYRVSSDIDGLGNYGEWDVAGSDTVVGANANFQSFVIDTSKAFDHFMGTAPALTAIRSVGLVCKFLTSTGRISFYVDDLKHGTGITIKDGTDAAPATFSAVAANDKTNGRGVTTSVGKGAKGETIFVSGTLTIGNDTTGGHVFKDSNFTVIFEDMPVSATHNKLVLVSNANGFGEITFGAKIGTGTGEVGIGGGTFQSFGARFKIDVIDAGLNRGNFYGTTIIGAGKTDLSHQNAKMISCNLDDCDELILSGNSVLKGSNISNSVGAAVRLLANPSVLNFRSNRIQNSPIGISFSSTIPGGIVDLADISFLGNTNDLEVTGSGTVTVNILEGDSFPVNILKPGGATVIVVNTKTVKFSGLLDDTEVRVYKTSDDSPIAGIETVVDGSLDNRSFTWSAVAGTSTYYKIHNVDRAENIDVRNFTVPTNNVTIAIQQRLERNYSDPV